jgi:hypothetical protein
MAKDDLLPSPKLWKHKLTGEVCAPCTVEELKNAMRLVHAAVLTDGQCSDGNIQHELNFDMMSFCVAIAMDRLKRGLD